MVACICNVPIFGKKCILKFDMYWNVNIGLLWAIEPVFIEKKAIFMSLFVPSYNGYTPDMVLSVGQNLNVVNILPSSTWKMIRVAKETDQWQMFLDKSCLICLSGWFHSNKVLSHSTVFVYNKGPVCEFNCPKHPELRHKSCHSPPGPTICCPSWSPCRLEESTLTVYDSVSEYQAGAA